MNTRTGTEITPCAAYETAGRTVRDRIPGANLSAADNGITTDRP